jgi:hypothetical protein
MLIDNISTIVVEPGATAHITVSRDVRIELGEGAAGGAGAGLGTECDPIQLAIFSHRHVPGSACRRCTRPSGTKHYCKPLLRCCHARHACLHNGGLQGPCLQHALHLLWAPCPACLPSSLGALSPCLYSVGPRAAPATKHTHLHTQLPAPAQVHGHR